MKALSGISSGSGVHDAINSNKGGPYGFEELRGVLDISDQVWNAKILGGEVGKGWYRSVIKITAGRTIRR